MIATFRNLGPALLLTLLPLVSAVGGEPITLPQGGEDVVAFHQDGPVQLYRKNAEAKGTWTAVKEMPFTSMFRVEFSARPKAARNAQLIIPIKKAFKKGNTMLLSFWVRSPESKGKPGTCAIYVQEGTKQPRFGFTFSVSRPWQQCVRPFKAPADYDPKQGSISIHLGDVAQTIEIAGLRLVDYGPDVDIKKLPASARDYQGREADATWRKDALRRIEKIRKADLTIEVVNADGKPLKDANVKVQMQCHAFGFGTAVNSMVLGGAERDFPITRKRRADVSQQDAQKYREIVKSYFNRVTFEGELHPHKWKLLTGDNPGWKHQYSVLTQQTVPWLQQNNISIRGHYIGWGAMDFPPLQKDFVGNPKGHRQWLWEHMADVLPKTSDYVSEWDTINHIVAWGKHTYEIEYGGMQIHADIMKEARRLAPQTTHAINEGMVLPNGYKREPYKRIIRFMNDQGQPPDVVGFMAHFGLTTLTPPEELLEVYDSFAEIAPRLQLSELDVETGDDEQLQADYLRDVVIATFSQPNFVSIAQWGFWENDHWKPKAALWRSDWSIKPAGEVFVDLVTRQWWTDETGRSDDAGNCQVRGFLGDYKVTVEHDGKTKTTVVALKREGKRIRVQFE